MRDHPSLQVLLHEAFSFGPLLAHVIVTVLLYVLWRAPAFAFAQAPTTLLALLLMLFGGPIGAAAGVVAALLDRLIPATWGTGITAVVEPPAEQPQSNRQSDGPRRASAQTQQSFCDVFRIGSLAQRRTAVSLIGANFTPQLTEALRMALNDEHNSIRVQAGMVLMQLEDEFDRRQVQLEAGGEGAAALQGFWADENQLELAKFFDMQAYCGLFDANRTRTAQISALGAYRSYLATHPGDLEVIAAVGRLLVRANQHQLATEWLGQQVASGHHTLPILVWYLEALFVTQHYEVLRTILAEHGQQIVGYLPQDAKIHGFLQLWLTNSKTAAMPARIAPLDDPPIAAPLG